MPTAGVVDVSMDNGVKLNNVVLTSGMGVPVLIGTDVLEANKGLLDYSRNILVLGEIEYQVAQRLIKSPGVAEVLLESDLDGLTRQFEDVFYSKGHN